MQRSSHPWPAVGAAAALAALALAPGLAQATTVTDPVGDFLPTYTGPLNGDMDVIAAGCRKQVSRGKLLLGRRVEGMHETQTALSGSQTERSQ